MESNLITLLILNGHRFSKHNSIFRPVGVFIKKIKTKTYSKLIDLIVYLRKKF